MKRLKMDERLLRSPPPSPNSASGSVPFVDETSQRSGTANTYRSSGVCHLISPEGATSAQIRPMHGFGRLRLVSEVRRDH
jgi:hypothetical protein